MSKNEKDWKKYHSKKPHRVRMTAEEFEQWKSIKDSDEIPKEETLEEFAKRREINLSEVHQVWHKGKLFSVKTKPGAVTYDQVKEDLIAQMDKHSNLLQDKQKTNPGRSFACD